MKQLLLTLITLLAGTTLTVAQSLTLTSALTTKGPGYDEGRAVTTSPNGRVLVLGSFDTAIKPDPATAVTLNAVSRETDYFVTQYTASGQYVRGFVIGVNLNLRGLRGDITTDAAGNIYVGGTFRGTTDFDPGPGVATLTTTQEDGFIAKYDSTGTYQWAFQLGGGTDVEVHSLAADATGNVYVTGYFNGAVDFNPGPTVTTLRWVALADAFVAKYTSEGQYAWAFSIGGSTFDQGAGIDLTRAGNLVVTGYFWNTVDLDPGPAVASVTTRGNSKSDAFVVQYSPDGTYQWGFALGGLDYDEGTAIASDGANNVYVTGKFIGSVDFDPSSNEAQLTSYQQTRTSAFIAKYNASGRYQWAQRIDGPSEGQALSTNATGEVVLTGTFTGQATIGSSATMAAVGYQTDAFVALYQSTGGLMQAFPISSTNGEDQCPGALLVDDGTVWLTGSFERNINVSLDAQPWVLTAAKLTDCFLVGYRLIRTANVCQSIKSGNWNEAGTWSCGQVPAALSEVVIAAGHTVLLNETMPQAVCHSLTLQGTFSMQGGALTIDGMLISLDQTTVLTR